MLVFLDRIVQVQRADTENVTRSKEDSASYVAEKHVACNGDFYCLETKTDPVVS